TVLRPTACNPTMIVPSFYYRRAVADDRSLLDEGDGFFVYRRNGVVAIDCREPWRPEFERAYRRNDAKCVSINTFSVPEWEARSLDFLLDLSGLRHLSLIVHFPMDLTPLGDLIALESLTLAWNAPGPPGTIDFTRLAGLQECCISWHASFLPFLQLGSL